MGIFDGELFGEHFYRWIIDIKNYPNQQFELFHSKYIETKDQTYTIKK